MSDIPRRSIEAFSLHDLVPMPRKEGKSTSPKKKKKMATGGVETPSNEGGEHEHENESHDSEEEAQRRPEKDGVAPEKDPRLTELSDSLSSVMSKKGQTRRVRPGRPGTFLRGGGAHGRPDPGPSP